MRWMGPAEVCVINDPRAIELSGLVVTSGGYVAINDSQNNADNIRVIYLDATCKVTKTLRYPSPARDPEDLAVAPDGTLWVADIGDNLTSQTRRQSIALWKVPADGGVPVIHRMTYPDGPHDAEALLFTNDGIPIIVTKETTGKAGLYTPTSALQPQSVSGVPLKRVGEFLPQAMGENNLLGAVGETMVTGAATSPDRRRVALRTYTAAYEWDVVKDDVIKTITTGTPRVTALPDEPQGEAIGYTPDGKTFVTVSDEQGTTTLRSHVPSTEPLVTPPPTTGGGAAPVADPKTGLAGIPIWYSVAACVAGLALLIAGLLGVRRARRNSVTGLSQATGPTSRTPLTQ
ncbi:MAG: hypothetical protein QOE61_1308 [Micromonosporaceae bacterium]|nr:hypothetical protein [Micromonosporaceae bacterium]